MRRIFIAVSAILIVVLSCQSICFAKSVEYAIDQDILSEEFLTVIHDITGSHDLADDDVLYDYQASYKLYSTVDFNIVSAYNLLGSMENVISEDNCRWMLPTKDGTKVYTAILNGNKWQVIGSSAEPDPETAMAIVSTDTMDKAQLRERLVGRFEDIVDIKYIWAPLYHGTFAYIQAEGCEYLVPQCSRPDFTGLENGELYEASVVIETLGRKMPISEEDAYQYGGGTENSGTVGATENSSTAGGTENSSTAGATENSGTAGGNMAAGGVEATDVITNPSSDPFSNPFSNPSFIVLLVVALTVLLGLSLAYVIVMKKKCNATISAKDSV